MYVAVDVGPRRVPGTQLLPGLGAEPLEGRLVVVVRRGLRNTFSSSRVYFHELDDVLLRLQFHPNGTWSQVKPKPSQASSRAHMSITPPTLCPLSIYWKQQSGFLLERIPCRIALTLHNIALGLLLLKPRDILNRYFCTHFLSQIKWGRQNPWNRSISCMHLCTYFSSLVSRSTRVTQY